MVKKKSSPLISIVIPVYNRTELLKRVIGTIFKQEYTNYEIIIVDDNSSENVSSEIKKYPCKVIRNSKNLGPGESRNIGVDKSQGDIIFFTDSDVLLPADSLSIIVDELSSKSVDAVVGLLSTKIEYDNFASNYKNLYMHYTYLCFGDFTNVFFTSVAAVKKKVFNAIGGFDAKFGIKPNEDLEIGLRLYEKHVIKSSKKLQVEHVKYYSWVSVLLTDYDRGSSIVRIMLRRRNTENESSNPKVNSYPITFAVGILMSAISLLSFPLSLISLYFVLIMPLSIVLIGAINIKFIIFLHKTKGYRFAVKSFLFLYLDILAYGFGIFKGITGFIMGKKY